MDCREKIVSEDSISIILDFRLPEQILPLFGEGFCYQQIEGTLGVYYVNRDLQPPLSASRYLYRYIPQLYGLESFPAAGSREFNRQPLEVSGILAQQRPPLSLTGRGVLLAVIDTGIDYEDPAFRYSDGSTRIRAIWDQTDQSGEPPEGFAYGTLYTREQIDKALSGADPGQIVAQRDEIGHGTAMASAAAGSRLDGGVTFTGAAPDAELVVVKLKQAKQYLRDYYFTKPDVPAYSTDDLMFGIKFAESFAVSFFQPVVILLGVGTSLGCHNGTSLLSEYIQSVSQRLGRVVVTGGGNEGNSAGHFRAILEDTMRPAEIRVGENTRGFMAELWGMQPAEFRISVRSPGGEMISEVDFRLSRAVDYTFVYERTRLRMDYVPNERNTGDELIVLRFDNPTPGIWTILVRGERTVPNAIFDLWLSPRQFIDGEVSFLTPSPEVTLTMPSYEPDAVSVSTYNSQNGSFYFLSGQGFSRTGKMIKPDLAAPGVSISTIRGPYSGGAMAAALTAGAVAQLLQWAVAERNAPFVSGREIRTYLTRGAREETGEDYPSRRWGYGRLDLRKTFDEIAGI